MRENVFFEGPGPYNLPTAQRAAAAANDNNGVTVTFYALVRPGTGEPAMAPVRVQMAGSVAKELAGQLMLAAAQCDVKSR
jgi:hypothetical protein